MKTTLTTLALTATLTAPVLAGGHITPPTTVLGQDCCGLVGDGDNAYNGKKNGWEGDAGKFEAWSAPRGLDRSAQNGRVDNGTGNGGENGGFTNKYGEDGFNQNGDEDPNQ